MNSFTRDESVGQDYQQDFNIPICGIDLPIQMDNFPMDWPKV
jgi:hypothetical protein